MTGIVWNIAGGTTTVATDSRWWDSTANAPGGLSSKLVPLPAHNVVLAGGTWGYMMGHVVSRAVGLGFRDLDDLRDGLGDVIGEVWEDFRDEAADHGVNPDLCVIWLLGPGCGWLYGNEQDFKPIKLPAGLWCDPHITADGGCRVAETFRGDPHLVEIMRRQRGKRAKPEGYPIGGYVTRATITRDGMDVRRIADLEAEESPVQTTHPRRKIGRNEACPCGSGHKYKQCCQQKMVG